MLSHTSSGPCKRIGIAIYATSVVKAFEIKVLVVGLQLHQYCPHEYTKMQISSVLFVIVVCFLAMICSLCFPELRMVLKVIYLCMLL